MKQILIPPAVCGILQRLEASGFEAYAVGGCVRDSLLGKEPNDWDICTSAKPEETAKLFSHTVLTGVKYGTVTVIENDVAYEITTFRTENGYSDHRHPDEIVFLNELQGDLARRDFSINAMAADARGRITDLFDGLHDLRHGLIRCVGVPDARFHEDALRIVRALRFASRLNFSIEPQTAEAIHRLCPSLKAVAPERLHKELQGLLCGAGAAQLACEFSDVLCVMIPELAQCMGFKQYNHHHRYDVWKHTLMALSAETSGNVVLRLALLLHDIGKPAVFSMDKNGVGHFYGHAVVSAAMAENILRRLRFDNATIHRVCLLIRLHDYPLLDMTERGMRRFLAKYGEKVLRELIALRCADRLGKGTEEPADIQAFQAQLLSLLAQRSEISAHPLQINGRDLLAMGVAEGPKIGALLTEIQNAVFDELVENDHEALVNYAQEFIGIRKTD